ncbi:MAG: hypothetical protein Q8M03_12860 [Legionella sp.]|nr:hypothetical protein [Legionella sp.]
MHHQLDLKQFNGSQLINAITNIPAGVTTLDLRGNRLGHKTGAELAQVFAAIPASVTSLDLSDNYLDYKTGAELALICAAIPTNVTVNWGFNIVQRTGNSKKESSQSLPINISMQVLGGFIAVVGCAAVATAFVLLLNAATFGVVASLGVAFILAGVGLFAAGTYGNRQETPNDSLVKSASLAVD